MQELPGSNAKNEFFQAKIEGLVDEYFPIKSYSIKSTDDPWISDHYRKESRKTRKEYKKNGKSERYFRLKEENKVELSKLKKNWYDKECSKITTPGVVSYNALKNLNRPECPKSWNVLNLAPEKS